MNFIWCWYIPSEFENRNITLTRKSNEISALTGDRFNSVWVDKDMANESVLYVLALSIISLEYFCNKAAMWYLETFRLSDTWYQSIGKVAIGYSIEEVFLPRIISLTFLFCAPISGIGVPSYEIDFWLEPKYLDKFCNASANHGVVTTPAITSIPCLLMPWLRYWLCKLGRSLSYLWKDFNDLCHVSVKEW